jgi:hypothetical protein
MRISHSVRRSVLEQEVTWSVTPEVLERSEQGKATMAYPLADVLSVRIAYDPTRVDDARHWCDITLQSKAVLRIVSTHYRGIADFEDRGKTYAAMTRALIAALGKINPACTFDAGKPKAHYIGEILLMVAALLFLAVVLFNLGFGTSEIVMAKLVLLGAMVPVAIAYIRKNRPRIFTPDRIPGDALPSNK